MTGFIDLIRPEFFLVSLNEKLSKVHSIDLSNPCQSILKIDMGLCEHMQILQIHTIPKTAHI